MSLVHVSQSADKNRWTRGKDELPDILMNGLQWLVDIFNSTFKRLFHSLTLKPKRFRNIVDFC